MVATPALAGDRQLAAILAQQVPRAESAGDAALNGRGSPEAIQAQYDASRDLQQGLDRAAPVTRGCTVVMQTARELANAEIMEAEGVDRPARWMLIAGIARVASAKRRLAGLEQRCTSGPTRRRIVLPELDSPRSGEVFNGEITARVPLTASRAEILVNGRAKRSVPVTSPTLEIALNAPPGRYDISVRFRDGSVPIRTDAATGVWLLPRSAFRDKRARTPDRPLNASLAAVANSFDGYSAMWVQNLATGVTAAWNADARFPAASTVKLAVLVAALKRYGPRPEQSPAAYDMQTLGGWSSNLAANRLLVRLGNGSETRGTEVANTVLKRLGATSSTYTGEYRVGTSAARDPNQPPFVSGRVTTARDLGTILYQLDAAAMGNATALKRTQLTRHEAEIGLGLLLESEPTGDNLGLFRPWVGKSFPMAQKNGWLSDARHTAAILFAHDGPRIVVVLTYREGIMRAQAAVLGRRVLKLALSR